MENVENNVCVCVCVACLWKLNPFNTVGVCVFPASIRTMRGCNYDPADQVTYQRPSCIFNQPALKEQATTKGLAGAQTGFGFLWEQNLENKEGKSEFSLAIQLHIGLDLWAKHNMHGVSKIKVLYNHDKTTTQKRIVA